MLSLIGFIMMGLIIWLLLSNKANPIVVFIIVPIIFALILGFSIDQISSMVKLGLDSVMNGSIMMLFSVLFFAILGGLGTFNIIVDKVIERAGERVLPIMMATAVITLIVHISGAVASTVLIVIPVMMPIYKRLGIKPLALLCLVSLGVGVMNLVPWCGGMVRAASILNIEPTKLWIKLAPIQAIGMVLVLVFAFFMARSEEKRIKKEGNLYGNEKLEEDNKLVVAKNPILNLGLTIAIILILISNIIPSYLGFMIGLSLVLILNYPSLKAQTDIIGRYSDSALTVSVTMLTAGVMVGILRETGMLQAMSKSIVAIVPLRLGKYIHLIFGILGMPLGVVTGADAYFYGVMPLIIDVGIEYGVDPFHTGIAMILSRNMSVMISPLVGSAYLATNLTNIDLSDHLKYSFKWIYLLSLGMLIIGILLGVISI